MTCPRCHSEFDSLGDVCPECGVNLMRNVSGVMKTSAVLISAGGARGFYNSVKDVPEPLRAQLLETTSSENSGTIVIADRAGKEQLTQALARREAVREAVPPPPPSAEDLATPTAPQTGRLEWLAWAGLLLVLAIAAIASAIFYLHW
jgi:hypothetical protein